nr:hypothetical protein [Polyangiaceae bacterium]
MHGEPLTRHPSGYELVRSLGDRGTLLPLLRLADDSEPAVAAYHSLGQAFVLQRRREAVGV